MTYFNNNTDVEFVNRQQNVPIAKQLNAIFRSILDRDLITPLDFLWLTLRAEVSTAVADGDALSKDIDNHHWRK